MASFTRGRCLLKPLLKRINMSQSELARRSGYSTRMISYFANDQKKMSADAMYTISQIIGCSMEALYEWVKVSIGTAE